MHVYIQSGEEIPASAIPTVNDNVSKATLNSYYPLKRRKKRRKSSSSSAKWACTSNTTDSESRPVDGHDNNRTMPYENKDDDTTDQTDDTGKANSTQISREIYIPREGRAKWNVGILYHETLRRGYLFAFLNNIICPTSFLDSFFA